MEVVDKSEEELKKRKGAYVVEEEDTENLFKLGHNHFMYRYKLTNVLKYPVKLPQFDQATDFPAGTSTKDFVV